MTRSGSGEKGSRPRESVSRGMESRGTGPRGSALLAGGSDGLCESEDGFERSGPNISSFGPSQLTHRRYLPLQTCFPPPHVPHSLLDQVNVLIKPTPLGSCSIGAVDAVHTATPVNAATAGAECTSSSTDQTLLQARGQMGEATKILKRAAERWTKAQRVLGQSRVAL